MQSSRVGVASLGREDLSCTDGVRLHSGAVRVGPGCRGAPEHPGVAVGNAEPVATPNSRQPWREPMRPGCRTSDCLPTFTAGRLSVSLSLGGNVCSRMIARFSFGRLRAYGRGDSLRSWREASGPGRRLPGWAPPPCIRRRRRVWPVLAPGIQVSLPRESPNNRVERTDASRLVFGMARFMIIIRQSVSALTASVAHSGRSA